MKKALIVLGTILILIIGFFAIYIYNFKNYSEEISIGEHISKYDNLNSALLVIDIQEGTTGTMGDEAYQSQSDEYIKTVNDLIWKADSLEIHVIYIRSELDDPVINFLDGRYAPDSEGALLDKRLSVISDLVYTKDKGDSFSNYKLDSTLRSLEISKLFITGLDAAKCVNSTISGALNRGYDIEVIVPGLAADSKESLDNMLKVFSGKGITLSKDITD